MRLVNKQMNFGENIARLRERKGITQIEISKLLNISNSLYSRYEKEIQIIPLKHLNTLCEFYHVSFDYIFGFSNIYCYENEHEGINQIEIGKRLKQFRKDNKLTQVKLAQILNTVHPVIVNYENGRHLIATPFLYDICKKYHISADYLLGKIDTPKYLYK